jgi:hypothetical protein
VRYRTGVVIPAALHEVILVSPRPRASARAAGSVA